MQGIGLAIVCGTALVACEPANQSGKSDDNSSSMRTNAQGSNAYMAPHGSADAATLADGANWQEPGDHKAARFIGMIADKPATWVEHPPAGSLETTRFNVPGRDENPAAEIVVFFFGPSSGGTLEANIDRWRKQFRPNEDGSLLEPTITELETTAGFKVTLVELVGDWVKMGAASYTPDQHFITAVVDSPNGMVFIRFVGAEATVGPNRDTFINMIKSLREDGANPNR